MGPETGLVMSNLLDAASSSPLAKNTGLARWASPVSVFVVSCGPRACLGPLTALMRPGCQASRLAVWRRERSALDETPRPTDAGPGLSTWKRRYRMIRLRCIRTSPDPPSMLRFVADYKGRRRFAAARLSGLLFA